MLRLGRAEQVAILAAVQRFPDDKHLGQWLKTWVEMQVDVGPNKGIDITEIPIVYYDEPPLRNARGSAVSEKEQRTALLAEIGYTELAKNERSAIRKFLGSGTVTEIEETDRSPDNATCWLGTHEMEDWEDLDCYLWLVRGTWNSGIAIRKWGCKSCALAIAKIAPEAVVKHAIQ
jgi:hypothetical protein